MTDTDSTVWTFGKTPNGSSFHLVPDHVDRLAANDTDTTTAAACGQITDRWNTRDYPADQSDVCNLCLKTGWTEAVTLPDFIRDERIEDLKTTDSRPDTDTPNP